MLRGALRVRSRPGLAALRKLSAGKSRTYADAPQSVAAQLLAFVSQKLESGNSNEALQVLEHGASLVRSQTGDSDDTAAVLIVSGILDTHREKWKEAVAANEDAAKAARTKEVAVAATCSLAAMNAAKRDHAAAISAATDAVRLAEDASAAVVKMAAQGSLGAALPQRTILHAAGKYAQAEEAFSGVLDEGLGLDVASLSPISTALFADATRGLGAWKHSRGEGDASTAKWYSRAHGLFTILSKMGGLRGVAVDFAARVMAQDRLIDVCASMGQLEMRSGDLDAAERHFGNALHSAELLGGPGSVSVGVMLALSADVYMARAAAAAMQQGGSGDAGGVLIAEGLYRKSFSVLGITLAAQDSPGKTKPLLSPPLEALLKARYGQMLAIAGPMRRAEAVRWTQEALKGWPDGTLELTGGDARPWAKQNTADPAKGGSGCLGAAVVDVRLRAVLRGQERQQDAPNTAAT